MRRVGGRACAAGSAASPTPSLTEGLPLFRTQMVGLLRLCWGRLTATMVVSQLTVVLVLGICVRMQGLDESTISWAVILVAWGLVTFASLLIPTPGGLGVAEVVLVGVLGHGLPAVRPVGGAGGRAALPHRHLPGADPDRPGHLPLLAPVHRVAPAGRLARPERPRAAQAGT